MKKLTKLLFSQGRLRDLQHQLAAQEQLLQQVRACLPSPLDRHCLGAIPRAEVLILLVESSAWASRLRYLASELLKQLRRRQIRFKRIQIRVSVDTLSLPIRKTSRRAIPLSSDNAKRLRDLAASMDDDQLRSALQRLSRHTNDGTNV
jgi:hypothetical protein